MNELGPALSELLTPMCLLLLLLGAVWGIVSSAIPGMTTAVGLALLLPLTFTLSPIQAIVLLAATWSGSEFGGAIPAILINTPGSPASAATTLDGHMLFRQGKGGKALGAALVWGLIGQFVSVIICAALLVPLSTALLAFGPLEIFAVAIFGLTIVVSFGGSGVIKALLSLIFGLMVATIGFDPFSGISRLTFGLSDLEEGLGIVPVLIGLFAIGELLSQASKTNRANMLDRKALNVSAKLPSLAELKAMSRTGAISTVIGIVVGIMPGAGGMASSYAAWNESRRWSKQPELFGKGSMEGVVASETANNANIPGSIVPMLAFSVPGDAAAAVFMGGLLIQGIRPGPELFSQHVDVLWALLIGLIVSNPVILGLGMALIKPAIGLVNLPRAYVQTGILGLVVTGAYAANNSAFDILVVAVFGVVGWGMIKFSFSPGAAVLGLVLGEILESNLRRSLTFAGGDPLYFLSRPIATVMFALAVLTLAAPVIGPKLPWKRRRRGILASAVEAEVQEHGESHPNKGP
jgi:putative tricarboxylic transport membrane protein